VATVPDILEELVDHHAGEDQTNGVRDSVREAELMDELRGEMEKPDYREAEARWFRERYLSDKAVKAGRGMEDAAGFYEWLQDH
jgi:hypothetical protein